MKNVKEKCVLILKTLSKTPSKALDRGRLLDRFQRFPATQESVGVAQNFLQSSSLPKFVLNYHFVENTRPKSTRRSFHLPISLDRLLSSGTSIRYITSVDSSSRRISRHRKSVAGVDDLRKGPCYAEPSITRQNCKLTIGENRVQELVSGGAPLSCPPVGRVTGGPRICGKENQFRGADSAPRKMDNR